MPLVGETITLVTEQFTDGVGAGAMSVHDGKIVLRTHVAETQALVIAVYPDESFRVKLDDDQEWHISKEYELLSRSP